MGKLVGWIAVILIGGFLVSRCEDERSPGYSFAARSEDRAEELREEAAEEARDAVSGTTYQEQGAPYGCTEDCSGHDAGYEWASENDVTDKSDCGGNSQSFIEGCEAFAEAYQAAKEEALEERGVEEE